MQRIAILTDRLVLANGLSRALASSETEIVWYRDQHGLLNERAIDAVVACVPDPVDFTAVIRRVTASPLLVLSDEGHAATCLNLGADVWAPLETSPAVVAAQVRRLLESRRQRPAPSPRLAVGDISIDTAERRVMLQGKELELSRREYDLLRVMAENRGKALSRDAILAAAWGPRFVGEPKTVDVHIAWLRQKLDGSGLRVTTIRGLGYRLDVMSMPAPKPKPVAQAGVMGRPTPTGP